MLAEFRRFRLFVSSTFNDFRREREVLQTRVFPEIRRYCAAHNYSFQPIDLRWGVSDETQLDQKTLELCLNEVRACKSHIHPNFLIMIGDRYGWVPLPYAIELTEFEHLLGKCSEAQQASLKTWYLKDLNQLPGAYILRERAREYADPATWFEVETHLRSILQDAVKRSELAEHLRAKYFLSATEAEVVEGIMPYMHLTEHQRRLIEVSQRAPEVDTRYIFGFFRDIKLGSRIGSRFIQERWDYQQAQAFKTRVKARLGHKSTLRVRTRQLDANELEGAYLERFVERLTSFLKSAVDEHRRQEVRASRSELELEIESQRYFAEQKRSVFMGQRPALQAVTYYLASSDQRPHVVGGASGRGKSSLMAQAVREAESAHGMRTPVVYRFVGATPNSTNSKQLLISIFDQLGDDVRSRAHQGNRQRERGEQGRLSKFQDDESFSEFSDRIHARFQNFSGAAIIFIDAIDQIENEDELGWLPAVLPAGLKIIISALNDPTYPELSRHYERLHLKGCLSCEIVAFEEPLVLLHAMLGGTRCEAPQGAPALSIDIGCRTLQPHQEAYFLKQQDAGSPLYVTIAAHTLKHWRSDDGVPGHPPARGGKKRTLERTQREIITAFIDALHAQFHHDEAFVRRVLGYLYASEFGLSERELLQLCAADPAFVSKMAPETWHENPNGELPMVHWSRLNTQLRPFLKQTRDHGEVLNYLFHREFVEAISRLEYNYDEHQAILAATEKILVSVQHAPFFNNRWGRLYGILVTRFVHLYGRYDYLERSSIFVLQLESPAWIEAYFEHALRQAEMYDYAFDKRAYLEYLKLKYYARTKASDPLWCLDLGKYYHDLGGYEYLHVDWGKGLRNLVHGVRFFKKHLALDGAIGQSTTMELLSQSYGRIGEMFSRAARNYRVSDAPGATEKSAVRNRKAIANLLQSEALLLNLVRSDAGNLEYSRKLGVVYERLANAYRDSDDFGEVRKCFFQAFRHKYKSYDKRNDSNGFTMRKLFIVIAGYYLELGRKAKASLYLRRAIASVPKRDGLPITNGANQYYVEQYHKLYALAERHLDPGYSMIVEQLRSRMKARGLSAEY